MDDNDFLIENYQVVNKLDNGYIHAIDKNNNEIYSPATLGPSTNLYGYLPGTGGSVSDAAQLRKQMESENPPNCVVVISSKYSDDNNILNQGTKYINSQNSTVNKVVVNGFSRGARETLPCLEKYLENHPNLSASAGIIMTDGKLKGEQNNDYYLLKNEGVPIIYISGSRDKFEEDGQLKVDSCLRDLTEAGYNAIGVKSYGEEGHPGYNKDVIENSFAFFLFGDVDEVGNDNINPGKRDQNPNYEFFYYDKQTGKAELILSLKETNDFRVLSSVVLSENPNLITPNGDPSPVIDRFKALGTFTPVDTKQFSTISSDYGYVASTVNEIKSKIAGSSFLSGLQSHHYDMPILTAITNNIDNYFTAVGDILTKLDSETNSIISIDKAYVDMEHYMAQSVENISAPTIGAVAGGLSKKTAIENKDKEERPTI